MVVAVIIPGGKAIFAVAPYKERALAKAKAVAELAAKEAKEGGREFKPVEPQVFLFATPAELYAAAGLPNGHICGQSILVKGRKCGRLVSGSDSGCQGTDDGGYRSVTYEHHVCEKGAKDDDCWNNYDATIGRFMTYKSKKACEDGALPLTNDRIPGTSCD